MNAHQITYEWIVEELDGEGDDPDILDVRHFDTFAAANDWVSTGPTCPIRIGLVRDVGDDVEGLTDRSWAYVLPSGGLPETFDYGGGERGARVPQRFHAEIRRAAS